MIVRQDPPGIRPAACWVEVPVALHIVSCDAASCPACQAHAEMPWWRRCGPAPSSTPMRRAGSREVVGSGCGSFTNLRETVYEILPGRGFEQAASVLGKNYAGTLGVDGWAPVPLLQGSDATETCYNPSLHRCHELLETATRGAVRFPRVGQGHPPARPRLARSARCWRDQPAWPARCQGTPPGEDEPPAARPIHQSCQPAIRETSATLSGQPLCVPRPCGRRGHQLSRRTRHSHRQRGQPQDLGGGNRTAKGAQAQSILMSVLQSCRHKGIRVIDIVTSNPSCSRQRPPSPLVNPSGKQLRRLLLDAKGFSDRTAIFSPRCRHRNTAKALAIGARCSIASAALEERK